LFSNQPEGKNQLYSKMEVIEEIPGKEEENDKPGE
jgi:hypothetical protein